MARSKVQVGVEAPWWARTVHLGVVALLGTFAIAMHADPRLVGGIAVMACAALGWTGPWPPRLP